MGYITVDNSAHVNQSTHLIYFLMIFWGPKVPNDTIIGKVLNRIKKAADMPSQ